MAYSTRLRQTTATALRRWPWLWYLAAAGASLAAARVTASYQTEAGALVIFRASVGLWLALLVVCPWRHWVALVAALAVGGGLNLALSGTWSAETALRLGVDVCQAGLAAGLLRLWLGPAFTFERLAHVFALIGVPVATGALLNLALVGPLALGAATGSAVWSAWREHWAADAIAFIVVAPAVVAWLIPQRPWAGQPRGWRAAAVPLGLLTFLGALAFSLPGAADLTAMGLLYLLWLVLVGLAAFAGVRALTLGLVVVAGAGLWALAEGRGFFSQFGVSAADRVSALQLYLSLASTGLLVLAALITGRRRAEADLHESEARFRLLAENSTDLILRLDLDGVCRYASPASRAHLGYPPEDLLGQPFLTFVEAADRAAWTAAQGALLTTIDQQSVVCRVRRQDGAVRWLEASGRAVSEPATGARRELQFTVRDVTDRQLAQFDLERRTAELAAINRIIVAAAAAQDLRSLLQAAACEIRQLLDGRNCGIALIDNSGQSLTVAADANADPAEPSAVGLQFPINDNASTQWVLQNRQSLAVADAQTDPRTAPLQALMAARQTRALLIAPLLSREAVIGTIGVDRTEVGRDFAAAEIAWLETLAAQLAGSIENLRLREVARRRAEEFAALVETARALGLHQDEHWLVNTVIERALELIPATGAEVFLYNEAAGVLNLTVARGLPLESGLHIQPGRGAAGLIARTWQPLLLDDYSHWSGRLPELEHIPFGAYLGVPMLYAGHLVGVLAVVDVDRAPRRFTQAEAELLGLLAGQAAGAIHNKGLLDEARQRADQLALLYDAGLALNGVLDPTTQLAYLLKIAGQALEADQIAFYRREPESQAVGFEMGLERTPAGSHRPLAEPGPAATAEASPVAWVARHRVPLQIADRGAEPGRWLSDPAAQSGLWVPVEHAGKLYGILAALSRQALFFNDRAERLLLLFANQTAVAIRNARLFAETERRLSRVQGLRRIDAAIAAGPQLARILGTLLEEVTAVAGVAAASLALAERPSGRLSVAASRGLPEASPGLAPLQLGVGSVGRLAAQLARVDVSPAALAPTDFERSAILSQPGFTDYHAVPLVSNGQTIGLLEVYNGTPQALDAEALDYLEALAGQGALAVDQVRLFEELQRSNQDLTSAYDATIEGWSRAVDLRDRETEGHTQRVAEMTVYLARALGVDGADLVHLRRGALLHDIGKLGIPDAILLKPDKLTEAEWQVMRRHPGYAYEWLSPVGFLRPALGIPYCHHERLDGSGYPRGLRGDAIPLAARIFAVADVWDALCSDRRYRPAWPEPKVLAYLQEMAGRHFDPRAVQALLELRRAAG